MVTTVRRLARKVSVIMLMSLAFDPALVLALPQPDPGAPGAPAISASGAASPNDAAASRPLAGFGWMPADRTGRSGAQPADHPPRWFEAQASPAAKSGSWWSRRTTAQKTWFIVGMVVGAYGIYAIASHDSGDGNGGGGGY